MPGKRNILTVVRLLVAGSFVLYGTAKVLGGQFIFKKDWVIDSRTTDGPTLVWTFYGYSPVYGRLIGLAELIPAILLLIPRTRLLGALALFAVSANITVMDFCFAFPEVKYVSLLLTVLCGVLVAADWRKLRLLFWSDATLDALDRVERQLETVDPAPAPQRTAAARIVPALIALAFVLFGLNVVGDILSAEPYDVAFARCVVEGWRREDLRLQSWQGSGWSGFNRRAEVRIQTNESPPRLVRVQVYKPHGFAAWQVTDYRED